MKLMSLLSLIMVLMTSFKPAGLGLDFVRSNYDKAASDKKMCETMIQEMESAKHNSATHLAYLGGLQTIWANHVFGPVNKLRTFKKGKKNIEQAISKEPDNAELRFIRLSVQKNAPSFLGYTSNIKEDVDFIRKNRDQIGLEVLNKNIEMILKITNER